jgi:hypothetical protein
MTAEHEEAFVEEMDTLFSGDDDNFKVRSCHWRWRWPAQLLRSRRVIS